jgi:YHS domain-containing protein
MDKIDPICGMEWTIQAHNHWFCSDHCVKVFEQQWEANNSSEKNMKLDSVKKENKWIAYVLIAVIVFWWVLSWTHDVMTQFMWRFFVVVSVLKLLDLKGFAEAYANYDLVSKRRFERWYVYPFIECWLWLAYVFSRNIRIVAVLTLVLMLIGTLWVAIKLLKKEKFRCACLGTKLNVPLTNLTLVEDVLMAVMALILIIS